MRDQKRNVLIASSLSDNELACFPNAGASIDKDVVVPIADFDAGGVAAIANRFRPWRRNGSSISPKVDFHSNTLDEVFGLGQLVLEYILYQNLDTFSRETKIGIDLIGDVVGHPIAAKTDSIRLNVMRGD